MSDEELPAGSGGNPKPPIGVPEPDRTPTGDADARQVYDQLTSLSDRTTPTRTAYLASIAGKVVILYDLQGRWVRVRAENIENYVAKGFTFEEPRQPAQPIPEGPGDPDKVSAGAPPAPPADHPVDDDKDAKTTSRKGR